MILVMNPYPCNPSTRNKIPQLLQTLIPQLFLPHVKKTEKVM